MTEQVAIGLAGTVGILLLGKPLDWLLRERPGRWIAPEAWVLLLIIWNVVAGAIVASQYEYALTADIGAQSGELRKTAVIGGTPLIALAGLVLLTRWRLLWERRRIPMVWALAVMFAVAFLGLVFGFSSGNATRYIASDTWRWAVLPLYGLLAAGEERPRAWPIVLAPVVVGMFTIATSAPATLADIGDSVKPGPISTLTFVGTAVAVSWAARSHVRLVIPLALLLVLEGIVTASSAARTAAVLAGVAIILAFALARRPLRIALALVVVGVPTAVLALAILNVDSVRQWAQPTIDRWEVRVDQEVIPREEPITPEYSPKPVLPPLPPAEPREGKEPRAHLPAADLVASADPVIALEVAQTVRVGDSPSDPEVPTTYPSWSSVGERREEVERSTDWLFRGGPAADAFRLIVGLGQGVEYLAPTLPPLDTHTKIGYRHHIHVTYVAVLVRNGAIGLLTLIATVALMLSASVAAMRRVPAGSMEGLATRVVFVATVVFVMEMVTGFVFIGTFEGGVLVAGAIALAVARWEEEQRSSTTA